MDSSSTTKMTRGLRCSCAFFIVLPWDKKKKDCLPATQSSLTLNLIPWKTRCKSTTIYPYMQNFYKKNMFYSIFFAHFENCCLQIDSEGLWTVTFCQKKQCFCLQSVSSKRNRWLEVTKCTKMPDRTLHFLENSCIIENKVVPLRANPKRSLAIR